MKIIPRHWIVRLISWWPPYLGAGVRIVECNRAITRIVVATKLRWWNRNLVNVHFGGTIYAMCDPFFMLMLREKPGPDYS